MAQADYPSIITTCLDAEDAPALATFWTGFLGLAYRPGQGPDTSSGFIVIDYPDGKPALAIQAVDRLPPATWPVGDVPTQAHLDLSVPDREALARQVERAKHLGARVLDDRSDDDEDPLVVVADPAGHPFCLIAPPAVRPGSASGGQD